MAVYTDVTAEDLSQFLAGYAIGDLLAYKGIAEGDKLQVLNASSSAPGVIEFREPQAQHYNFAPRVGFAWSPGVQGTTSIRGGFTMAYDNYPDNFGLNAKPPQLESTIDRDVLGWFPGPVRRLVLRLVPG